MAGFATSISSVVTPVAIGLLERAFARRSGDVRGGIVEGNIDAGKSV